MHGKLTYEELEQRVRDLEEALSKSKKAFNHVDGSKYEGKEHPSLKTLRTGKPCRNEIMGVYNRSGDFHWISINTDPIFFDDNQKPKAVAISFSDVTDQKNTEDELKRTLDATTDGIWTWNFKTNELFFSPKYYTMLGYAPKAFPATFENWIDLIHPDDQEGALATARAFLETKPDCYENEFRLRTRDGDYRWIRARARVAERDKNGEAVYMIGNHEDITEKKQHEEKLLLQSIVLDQIHDHVTITDLKGSISYVNQAQASSLGLRKEAIIGQTTEIFGEDPERGGIQRQIFNRTLKDGTWRGEMVNLDKNGSKHTMDCRTQIVHDEKGEPIAVCGIATDMTEYQNAKQRLRESEALFRTLSKSF